MRARDASLATVATVDGIDSERGVDTKANERGYVMPMTTLLLIPLMIFAALATDVGSWYIKADQAQKAADAAALAGAVWLPDTTAARAAALDAAAKNGFRDPAWVAVNGGTANAAVTIPLASEDIGIQVDIATVSPSFFGSVVLDEIDIVRRAIATITRPVRMGNPSNGLGTGNLAVAELGIPPDGVWLALNGYCQDHRQGDPISVGSYGGYQAGGQWTNDCDNAVVGQNPTFDADGYTFVADIPPGAGSVVLEIFEPGVCDDADPLDDFYSAGDRYGSRFYPLPSPQINVRVFANDDTQLSHQDNLAQPPVADVLFGYDDCSAGTGAGGRWYPIYTIPAGTSSEGAWYLQTAVRENERESGWNSFALRARPAADTILCTSQLDPSCPDLYALDWLSIYRPSFGPISATPEPAEFFLAEIDDEHKGKTVIATMFDPGEGMDNVQFLDPDGNQAEFDYRLVNCSAGKICTDPVNWPEDATYTNSSTCGGATNHCLPVTGNRFQDDYVVVRIQLEPDYDCGGNCWWKVRYTPRSGVNVTDRTTWSVRVVGGPVRLVE